MPKVILQGEILVPKNDLPSVLAELPRHIERTRKEQGCLVFEVTQSAEISGVFNVYEEFIDRDAFERHQARVKASHWGKITTSVERRYKIIETT